MVYQNTSLYFTRNEEEPRLGRLAYVYSRYILLTISQITTIYISRRPHPSPSNKHRQSGQASVTCWMAAYGTGSIASSATARPAALVRRRSTTVPWMSIGAIAPRPPHWHRTIPLGAFWHGRGMPARVQSMAGRCSGSPSRPLRRPSPPGRPSPRGCAGTLTAISRGSPSRTAALAANVSSPVAP
jgi:hypothetical protein